MMRGMWRAPEFLTRKHSSERGSRREMRGTGDVPVTPTVPPPLSLAPGWPPAERLALWTVAGAAGPLAGSGQCY